MNRKRIPRRRDGELRQEPANLTPVIASMRRDMQQHLLPRHAAPVSIGEGKWQSFGQKAGTDGFKILQIPMIRGGERSMKLRQGGRLGRIVIDVAMLTAGQMRGKDPCDDQRMVHQADRGMAFLAVVSDMKTTDAVEQIPVRPGLIAEQRS